MGAAVGAVGARVVGASDGDTDGVAVLGLTLGLPLGDVVGPAVPVGSRVGCVGDTVGAVLGLTLGRPLGAAEGDVVGSGVGAGDGAQQGRSPNTGFGQQLPVYPLSTQTAWRLQLAELAAGLDVGAAVGVAALTDDRSTLGALSVMS